jgi:hypothetical protein
VLATNSVTMQVVDAAGEPLAKVSLDGVVLVNADGLYVVQ